MTDFRTHSSEQAAIKRYLFGETTGDERESFEEKLFADEELFARTSEADNDMVDQYLAGTLTQDDRSRFERSLTAMPARQKKIRNARVLSEFIHDEKVAMSTEEPVNGGLWARISGLFALSSPSLGFAFAGLSLLLLASTFALYWSNNSLRNENARLQSATGDVDVIRLKEQQLNEVLEQSKQREAELRSRIDNESEAKENLTADLIKERENRKQLEADITRLAGVHPRTNTKTPGGETVTTLSLGNSRPQDPTTTTVKIENTAKQMAIVVKLPNSVGSDERLTVAVNGKRIGGTFSSYAEATGGKHITVSVAVAELRPGENKITVLTSSGTEVTSYSFVNNK